MKKSTLLPLLLILVGFPNLLRAEYGPESARIDSLIETSLQQHKLTPNAPASDETFVRRIYLDVIGRIPSKEETTKFLNDSEPNKRAKLIDALLASEGYVSNWFNYWADLLRIQSNMNNGTGEAYAAWVKDSLRANKPYDQMVRELVTADGFVWDNGAVGYYLRDAGMPLDNMSNTAQVFLGTRVVCAQCHNHPFDKWKQTDYYQMAAFTYGVETKIDPYALCGEDKLQKAVDKVLARETRASKKEEGRKPADERAVEQQIRKILEPLSYGVSETKPDLKLPADYKEGTEGYEGKASEPVTKAKALFAPDRIDKPAKPVPVDKNTRAELAAWMCDKENPRFTVVIANRLWKRVMGVGLVEPVDDFKDDTVASNPMLLKHLAEQMSYQRYDIKKYLRMVFNTRAYQRQATTKDVPEDQPYYFPGPALRRMSAEQIWDSIVTLIITNPEGRKSANGYNKQLEEMKKKANELRAQFIDNPKGAENLAVLANAMASAGTTVQEQISKKQKELATAREKKDAEKEKALQAEIRNLTEDRDKAIANAKMEADKGITAATKDDPFAGKLTPMQQKDKERKEAKEKEQKAASMMSEGSASDYAGANAEFYRASELASPMPQNHFLREFGQSAREVIDNANQEATVTQALDLMNGKTFEELVSANSLLSKNMSYALTPDEKAINLWLCVYNRYPTNEERALVSEGVKAGGKDSWHDVFWALLNSKEFIFIQ